VWHMWGPTPEQLPFELHNYWWLCNCDRLGGALGRALLDTGSLALPSKGHSGALPSQEGLEKGAQYGLEFREFSLFLHL
jgi:hypothetical protein